MGTDAGKEMGLTSDGIPLEQLKGAIADIRGFRLGPSSNRRKRKPRQNRGGVVKMRDSLKRSSRGEETALIADWILAIALSSVISIHAHQAYYHVADVVQVCFFSILI